MEERADRPMAFVIRVYWGEHGPRGHIVSVATGMGRVFDDLQEAIAFIEAQIKGDERPYADGGGNE